MKTKIKENRLVHYMLLFFSNLISELYFKFFMLIFRIFKIKNNKIVISNYYGKGYGDNAKYICDELLNQNIKFDIVWLCKNKNDKSIPNGIRIVKYNSIRGLYELTTAKIWLDNCRKSYHIIKRKNQFYIQLWHGCMMLKKVEFDVKEQLGKQYLFNMINDNKMINLMISNSEYFTKRCRESFKYSGDVLKCGEPRDDLLFNNNILMSNKFKQENGYIGKKILLYAPTFRVNYSNETYNIDLSKIYEILTKTTNDDWVVFVRLHPNVEENITNIKYNNNIINMSLYPDMQELLASADILITDYSSIMFESMMINKEVILYVNDIDNYVDDRGFYFNLDELPFPIAKNNFELIDIIKSDNFDYKTKYKEFKDKIGLYNNTHSSKAIVNIIFKIMKEDVKKCLEKKNC